ncbi:uncharacterized protein C8R40DRAFT_1072574 [Lentinula edodes]|uniref:uncharacterized protein n=1 Tax=Lentinula edodes TaxID=5353 RepID=UPI001E8CB482|nr:uncharacterized protein C8R40DRAFT_1072574 [Lentinula edodes]KAH7871266.1 hypothetical protein C8R40DRAFT_1072574 [Lentinula edodes]
MDPYRNFDHRPLCADHKEMLPPPVVAAAADHTPIAPSSGPVRTQKDTLRVSPYSSPSPEPQPRRQHTAVLPSPSSLSIESLSSELEYDSDRERIARLRNTQRYSGDHGKATQGSDNIQAERESRSRKSVTFSAEPTRRRSPPALVFEDDSDDDFLIPKPPGEVGRPGRGGYSLFEVLGWPKKKYDKVKKYINTLVEDHLECELPMSEQSVANVKRVRQQAVEKYIFLKEYSGLWAVDDFIRNHLKYQKCVLKKEKLEKIVAEARPAEKKDTRSRASGK